MFKSMLADLEKCYSLIFMLYAEFVKKQVVRQFVKIEKERKI